MRCDRVRPLFSDLFEGLLSGSLDQAARAHLETCAGCQREFETFTAATRRLRALGAAPAPPGHVAAVMAAVDEAARADLLANGTVPMDGEWNRIVFERAMAASAPPRGRLARVGSHLLTAALSAAAAAAVVAFLPAEPAPATTIPPAVVERRVPVELRLVTGEGLLIRDGLEQSIDRATILEPRAGDLVRVEHGNGFTLACGATGTWRLEARPAEPLEPQIVERVVEKVRSVPRGPLVNVDLRVDTAAVERAAAVFGRAAGAVGTALTAMARAPRIERDGVAAAPAVPVEPGDDPHRPVPLAKVPAAHRVPAVPAPVLVLRSAGRLTLETTGPPYEVVPGLITYLDDPDPQLLDLVRERLEAIRAGLESDPDLARKLVAFDPAAAARPNALARVREFFAPPGHRSAAENDLTEAELWSRWWEANALVILEADTWGTF